MDVRIEGREPVETKVIGIAGMTCDHCVRKVEKALRARDGVKDVRVDRGAAQATVTFDPVKTDLPALHDAVLRTGYSPKPITA